MAKESNFLGEFLKERKMVGAVAPSSKFLMKKMLKSVDFSKAKVIVELGPGTGVFTKGILDKMTDDAKLFSFELNKQFYEQIESSISDDRLILVNDSAEKLADYLKEHGIDKADYVISSLPLAVIPNPAKENILKASTENLKPEGLYIQFQYSLNAKKLLESKFSKINLDFTPLNIPPAFVYKCQL